MRRRSTGHTVNWSSEDHQEFVENASAQWPPRGRGTAQWTGPPTARLTHSHRHHSHYTDLSILTSHQYTMSYLYIFL